MCNWGLVLTPEFLTELLESNGTSVFIEMASMGFWSGLN